MRLGWLVTVAVAFAGASPAWADVDGGVAGEEAAPPRTLEERVADLEAQLTETKAALEAAETRQSWANKFRVQLGGYLDVGFFYAQGNGAGVRKDLDRQFPEYSDILASWVLVGDPLSTAINSRGDVADFGDSRAIRFDPVHSQGKPSFLVNTVNLNFSAQVGDDFLVNAMVDLLPRFRDITSASGVFVGDYLDVKLAYARYRHTFGWGTLSAYAGKIDSVLGVEYRTQEAPDRLTITPSLICRYTCGRPVGLKALGAFFQNTLEVALALTNGSHQIETFPFSNEVDFNGFKTGAGRISVRLPVGRKLELSASGAIGAQDRQPDDSVPQWQYGFAALLDIGDVLASAEFVTGRAIGKDALVNGQNVSCGAAPCLFFRGAYGQVGWFGLPVVAPYVRVDWRDAYMRSAREWAYAANVVRVTVGLRARLHANVLLKAEYVVNRELEGFEFPDDVFTSSLVLSY